MMISIFGSLMGWVMIQLLWSINYMMCTSMQL